MFGNVRETMTRGLLALTLAVTLGAGSTVLADESLLQSTARAVQGVEREQGLVSSANAPRIVTGRPLVTTVTSQPMVNWLNPARSEAQQNQGTSAVSPSGMRKRTKALLFLAIGAGFLTSAHIIDSHVLDVTPSHLGTRADGCHVPIVGGC
jgi:hypothetical protein